MVLVYCDFWAPILKILSNYLIFIVAFVTWDKHIDKYIRWAHIIVSQWCNLTQGYIWHICQFRWLFLVLHLIPWVTTTGCAILLSMYQIKYYFQYQTHQSRKSNIISSTSHTSQMIFPVPDTPNPHVKYYLQYQSHQPNIISSTRHTKPECQILFPVPVTPVKWYFKYQSHQPNIISGIFSPAKYYFQYQTHQQSHQQPKQPQQQGQTQFKSGHMEVTIFIFVIIKVTLV